MALVAVLFGVPGCLVWVVHLPVPSWSALRESWLRQHLSSDVVVGLAGVVFGVLWMWFIGTAIAEVVSLRAWRRRSGGAPVESAPPIPPGPGRWVRVLVRVAVVSTVAVSIGHGSVGALRPDMSVSADLAGPLAPPIDERERVGAAAVEADTSLDSSLLPFLAGLTSALMLSAGAIAVVDRQRRRQWRAARVGTRLAVPTLQQARTEMLLRSVDAAERLVRLDLALRAVAPYLVVDECSAAAALVEDSGAVVLFATGLAAGAQVAAPWSVRRGAVGSEWHLPAHLSLAEMAALAGTRAQPSPAMLHLGRAVGRDGELFVDVEAVGVLSVLSPNSADVLRSLAASAAVSPFLDSSTVVVTGLEGLPTSLQFEHVDSFDAALDVAFNWLGSTNHLAKAGTFASRASGIGDPLAPLLVVAAGNEVTHQIAADLVEYGAGRGLGVVTDQLPPTVRPDLLPWCVRVAGGTHVLEPLGLTIEPVCLPTPALAAVDDVLTEANRATTLEAATEVVPLLAASDPNDPDRHSDFVEPEWAFMVRVLGPVEVVSSDGVPVVFERSKALELIVWLSQHRVHPTRSAARTALWESSVRDATFANVVSDARRTMARTLAPPVGSEWIGRTLTDDLPLHDAVITDAELVAARVDTARRLPRGAAIDMLRPAVDLLGGLPFAGTSYLWTDAEGITSSLVLLAMTASIELAQHLLDDDDIDGVFWATGQGLRVLSGHEELIALRMRAHARRGDLAGVRHEWESYERALAADAWAAADPSPKLVALRAELLAAHASISR